MDILFAGFEVFTAVVMKSSVFWEIIPCRPLKVVFFDAGDGGDVLL
jgi:hypothetical protein